MFLWKFQTRRGSFTIERRNDLWHACCEGESLGVYDSPEAALDELVSGCTRLPSNDVEPSTSGLPIDLSGWELVPA